MKFATLVDGTKVAIGVQRPGAAKQIQTCLELAKDFLLDLQASGVEIPAGTFKAIVAELDSQMQGELNFVREAENLRAAKRLYEGENRRLADELHGFHFEVPQPRPEFGVYENVLVMDLQPGQTIRKSPRLMNLLGRPIAKSNLGLYFREGFVQADPHPGNFLVDEKTKSISVIDMAQSRFADRAFLLGTDERYRISQFLRAITDGRPERILSSAKAMAKSTAPFNKPKLAAELTRILQGPRVSSSTRVMATVDALESAGLYLDPKYTLNAFKGMLTLSASGYLADSEEFEKLARGEIERFLKLRKAPQFFLDELKALLCHGAGYQR